METRNPHGTVDSREMGSESLENKGPTKEPPPVLRIIRYMYHEKSDQDNRPLCRHHRHLGTRSEDPRGSSLQIPHVLHQILLILLGNHKTPRLPQCQWIQLHCATSLQGVEQSYMCQYVIHFLGVVVAYLLVDGRGCCYLILVLACRIPDLLHHQERLLDRHVPRVSRLADEDHIRCDERMPEPLLIDPTWTLIVSRSFGDGFGGF
jgi:hypothetical protein